MISWIRFKFVFGSWIAFKLDSFDFLLSVDECATDLIEPGGMDVDLIGMPVVVLVDRLEVCWLKVTKLGSKSDYFFKKKNFSKKTNLIDILLYLIVDLKYKLK